MVVGRPAMNPRIVVADDEPDVLSFVASNLRNAGYDVFKAVDGPSALASTRANSPHLLVLDLMMPGMSGLEVCRSLKAEPVTARLPIIMLTAKAEEVDRIVGLELGVDDYITKPFSPRELVLRIKSVLRRTAPEAGDYLVVNEVVIDRERCRVTVHGEPIDLTATELKLLSLLAERRGRVQSRDSLLNDVWGYDSAIDTRTVDTHIQRLRRKLGPAANCIETVHSFGYRIRE